MAYIYKDVKDVCKFEVMTLAMCCKHEHKNTVQTVHCLVDYHQPA